jgi:hypothetical protein
MAVNMNGAKVRFYLNSTPYRTESEAPYTMNGDSHGNYFAWPYTLGAHLLSVKVLNSTNAIIHSYDIGFTIVAGLPSSHFSHAETGGPYTEVDTDGDGNAMVALDGRGSHTHRFPGQLVSYNWTLANGQQFSALESPTNVFTVGVHTIKLTVTDNGGDVASDSTTVTVFNSTTPDIAALIPNTGSIAGGYPVQLVGTAFASFHPANMTVNFNGVMLTGPSQIQIINSTSTIQVMAPVSALAGSVSVTVTTPRGASAPQLFVYIDSSVPSIAFSHGDVLTGIEGPTAVAFGPDLKLYVGTQAGGLYKLTLNETYHVVNKVGPSYILNQAYPVPSPGVQSILGLAFHPKNTNSVDPEVYVSHGWLFHTEVHGYVGRITKVSGPTLETQTAVISGLPVSRHDHAVNGMDFGDHGELYIVVGGVSDNCGRAGALFSLKLHDSLSFPPCSTRIQMQEYQASLHHLTLMAIVKLTRSFQQHASLHIYTVQTLTVLWYMVQTAAFLEMMLKYLRRG